MYKKPGKWRCRYATEIQTEIYDYKQKLKPSL